MKQENAEERAAETISEYAVKIENCYAEIARCYEILAVLHEVGKMYLVQSPIGKDADEREAIELVRDAVRALEENLTMEQSKLARDEETNE